MSGHVLTWAQSGWGGLSFWRAWFPARVQARWLARMLTRPCSCGAEVPGGLVILVIAHHKKRCRKGPYRTFQPGPSRFVIHVDHAAFEIVEGGRRARVVPCAPEAVPC